MKSEKANLGGLEVIIYSCNTVVVGSGAAAFSAVDRLHSIGQKDIVMVTEGINKGTSRNTGSDKQTYYKLTLAGDAPDSVNEMAKTLFSGGSMDGDIALVEAALSAQCFYRLVDIGVAFPHNQYGEYIGYKTDHDPRQRATSVGPLTSKVMTEKLQKQALEKDIPIFDGMLVIGILIDKVMQSALGLIALNLSEIDSIDSRYVLFNCTNVIYATGGPAGIYENSVYPESQLGSTGIALEAGVNGKNLTESQYGIASTKFRWNLSGTYQQVLPRYVSTDSNGQDEREFLKDYFPDHKALLDAIFLKGYQWPFDPRKVFDYGSSLIDILVYNESVLKGRRVFLDYTKNPLADREGKLDFSILGKESYLYLEKSNALFGTPIERLFHMNSPAIDLYKTNGIDLYNEFLEIAVCAQHNNGGLSGNHWWESNVKHFFPVGEVNGTHGVYRPGGSALNSGQVGSLRAAQYVAARYTENPLEALDFISKIESQAKEKINFGERIIKNIAQKTNVLEIRGKIGQRMSKCGAHIRRYDNITEAIENAKMDLDSLEENTFITSIDQLAEAYKNRDLIITQIAYLSAIADYIANGGKSRGSYLVYEKDADLPQNDLPDDFRFKIDDKRLDGLVQELKYEKEKCVCTWREVRPLPFRDDWFENVWNLYRKDEIIRDN